MADQQVAHKIFRDQLLKAPCRPFTRTVTFASTDVPNTPFDYCGANTSSAMAPYRVILALSDVDLMLVGAGALADLLTAHEVRHSGTLPGPNAPEAISTSFTAVNDYALTDQPSFAKQMWWLMTSSELPYAKELGGRMLEIQQRLDEDEDEKITLSGSSVRHLLSFLETNNITRPQLAPTPSGYLMARWVIQGRKVTIHFYADGRAEYYISAPNPIHPETRDLDSSVTTADALPVKLGRLGALTWIKG